MNEDSLRKNLIDADCDLDLINEILLDYKDENLDQMMKRLKEYRFTLLERLRFQQKKLDCLDYLIVLLRKRGEENEKL